MENVMDRNVLAAGSLGGSPNATTLQVLLLDIARHWIPAEACPRMLESRAGMTQLPPRAGNTNALRGRVGSSHDSCGGNWSANAGDESPQGIRLRGRIPTSRCSR